MTTSAGTKIVHYLNEAHAIEVALACAMPTQH